MQQVSPHDLSTIGRLHRQHDESRAIRVNLPVLIHLIEVVRLRSCALERRQFHALASIRFLLFDNNWRLERRMALIADFI